MSTDGSQSTFLNPENRFDHYEYGKDEACLKELFFNYLSDAVNGSDLDHALQHSRLAHQCDRIALIAYTRVKNVLLSPVSKRPENGPCLPLLIG